MKTEKNCSRCGELKPLSEFYNNIAHSDGKQARCKVCTKAAHAAAAARGGPKKKQRKHGHHGLVSRAQINREREAMAKLHGVSMSEFRRRCRLMPKYGIGPEEFHQMLEAQGHKCAICGIAADFESSDLHRQGGAGGRLVVDHCHVTGKVRGLLCTLCNHGLGQLGDNAIGVRKGLAYLEAFENRELVLARLIANGTLLPDAPLKMQLGPSLVGCESKHALSLLFPAEAGTAA